MNQHLPITKKQSFYDQAEVFPENALIRLKISWLSQMTRFVYAGCMCLTEAYGYALLKKKIGLNTDESAAKRW